MASVGTGVGTGSMADRLRPQGAHVARAPGSGSTQELVLDIEGMTCASCVTRVERVLRRQDSVTDAVVNLATRTALVSTSARPESLIAAVEAAGYRARPHRTATADGAETSEYLRRLVVSAILTTYVVLLTFVVGSHGMGVAVAVWALTTPVQFYGGWPFIRNAARGFRHGIYTMDTLIAVGSLAAYGFSVSALLGGRHEVYFDTSAVIVTLVLVGKVLESMTRSRAGDAAGLLLRRGAETATVIRGDGPETVPVDSLIVGDVVIVLPGEKVPADGIVVAGASSVDLSMLTGESMPVDVSSDDEVFAPSLNGSGRLEVRVTAVGADARLSQIVRLLEATQASRAPIQRLADRVAARFVPTIFVLAMVTLLGWQFLSLGGLAAALQHATAVLLIACPCALGLATPAAIMAGSGRAAELGILFKSGEAFEAARAVDTVLLDKTGTLTHGDMTVVEVVPARGEDPDVVLALAAAVERGSEHPIARAVVRAAASAGAPVLAADGHMATPGSGIRATVEGHAVVVGRAEAFPHELAERAHRLAGDGLTVFGVWDDGRLVGLLASGDRLKAEAREVVRWMDGFGFELALVTGDHRATAEAIGREVGLPRVVAGVSPEGKVDEIRRLQARGKRVAFVGDGLNDGPALAQADLGIALGTGTDVAIEAADVKIMGGDLRRVVDALYLARWTYSVIGQNLAWAFAYNAVMVPLAMFGVLTPVVAAAAMAGSSVTVVGNALRLRRYRKGALARSDETDGPDPLGALQGLSPEEIHGSDWRHTWW